MARVEGIGVGWVSLLEAESLKKLFKMSEGSHPVAISRIGCIDEFYEKPMLELEAWAKATVLGERVLRTIGKSNVLLH